MRQTNTSYEILKIGDVSNDGQVTILDKDRLCYLVKNISHGASGIRTISKKLLGEYVGYLRQNPNATSNEAREALSGKSELDKFEYGYTSTLLVMAKMCLDHNDRYEVAPPLPLQQIFYGAPGTGKSYTINQDTKGEDVVRTTFHPDSDYSTFVGAYKPTTQEETVMTVIGTKAVPVENPDGTERKESKIVYEFVEQAFLKAYTKAWQNCANVENGSEPKKEYLVIEEINRGNCAQIFGDLFQLLDRNAAGFSDYPIQADKDMQQHLQKAFKGLEIARASEINALYDDGKDVVRQVLDGEILLLPDNLYIWATMNTSDQSLFPIDSAFKRRWDWSYIPISDAHKGWRIKAEDALYDWWHFLDKINGKIGETTNSEDKKLGYFFCKADKDGIISADTFVSKVIFYLWNDVFKDYEFSDAIFNDEDGEKLTFDKFHTAAGQKAVVLESKVRLFLQNLGLEPVGETFDDPDGEEESLIESSNLKEKRRQYWEAFLKYANESSSEYKAFFSGRKTPSTDQWLDFSIGDSECHLVVRALMSRNQICVLLYFNEETERFRALYQNKDEIGQELQMNLEWDNNPEKKVRIIKEEPHSVDFDNRAQWTQQFDFIIDRLIRMRTAFLKHLA